MHLLDSKAAIKGLVEAVAGAVANQLMIAIEDVAEVDLDLQTYVAGRERTENERLLATKENGKEPRKHVSRGLLHRKHHKSPHLAQYQTDLARSVVQYLVLERLPPRLPR